MTRTVTLADLSAAAAGPAARAADGHASDDSHAHPDELTSFAEVLDHTGQRTSTDERRDQDPGRRDEIGASADSSEHTGRAAPGMLDPALAPAGHGHAHTAADADRAANTATASVPGAFGTGLSGVASQLLVGGGASSSDASAESDGRAHDALLSSGSPADLRHGARADGVAEADAPSTSAQAEPPSADAAARTTATGAPISTTAPVETTVPGRGVAARVGTVRAEVTETNSNSSSTDASHARSAGAPQVLERARPTATTAAAPQPATGAPRRQGSPDSTRLPPAPRP